MWGPLSAAIICYVADVQRPLLVAGPLFRNDCQIIRENREAAKPIALRVQRANRFSTFLGMKTFGISSPIATKNFVNRFGASSEQFD
jgi:hypothetical protein